MSDDPAHRHQWKSTHTIDYCHFQEIVMRCPCGETSLSRRDRDFADGTQLAFASHRCGSCRERTKGHEPKHWTVTL